MGAEYTRENRPLRNRRGSARGFAVIEERDEEFEEQLSHRDSDRSGLTGNADHEHFREGEISVNPLLRL